MATEDKVVIAPEVPEEIEPVFETEDLLVDSTEVSRLREETEKSGKKKEVTGEKIEAVQPQPPAEDIPDWIDPAFLRGGKNIEEAKTEQARAYSEARKAMQRSQQEAADHRKTIDEFILSNLPKKQQEEIATLFSKELGLNDKQVQSDVMRLLEPVLVPLVNEVDRLRNELSRNAVINELDDDHAEIVQSDEFKGWALDNYSKETLRRGNDEDPILAKDIVRNFKKWKKMTIPAPKPGSVAPIQKTEPAFTEVAGEPVSPKVWSRRQIIEMQKADPNKYAMYADEIYAAYREGRVK